MAYKSFEELLKYEQYPWEYNIMNENEKLCKVIKFIHKALEYKYDSSIIHDCDGTLQRDGKVCELTRDIYRILWKWKDKDQYNKLMRYGRLDEYHDLYLGPETMTSFHTTFKQYVVLSENLVEKYKYKDYKIPIDSFDKLVLDIENDIEYYSLINDYCSNVGKIGNMTLTYAGYNRYTCKDYWDLKINYQYLSDKNISSSAKNLYVNLFFMWDYVNYDEKNQIYYMKEFYDGHINKCTPDDKDKIKKILEKVNSYINRRGFLMTLLLLLKIENGIEFDKIMKIIKDNSIHEMNEAINMVLSIYGLEIIDDEQLIVFDDTKIHQIYNEFKQKLRNEVK